MKAIVAASLAAILVQPAVFAILMAVLFAIDLLGGSTMNDGDAQRIFVALAQLSFFVILVAAVFVAVLGVPLFLALKRMGRLGWRSILLAGLLAAAVPYAIFAFPPWPDSTGVRVSYGEKWHGTYREFIVDGVYTIYGWLNYLEGIVLFGIQGLAGAAMFYFVWLKTHEPKQGAPGDGPRPAGSARA